MRGRELEQDRVWDRAFEDGLARGVLGLKCIGAFLMCTRRLGAETLNTSFGGSTIAIALQVHKYSERLRLCLKSGLHPQIPRKTTQVNEAFVLQSCDRPTISDISDLR